MRSLLVKLLAICAVSVVATAYGSGSGQPRVRRVCNGKVDVAYILDVSFSISEREWKNVEKLFVAITNSLRIGEDETRIGIVTFSTDVWMISDLDDCYTSQCVIDKIMDIKNTKISERTNIAGAFEMTHKNVFAPGHGNRSNVPDVCLLFTDGQANERVHETEPMAKVLRQKGCRIISIAIDKADLPQLRKISAPEDIFDSTNHDFEHLITQVEGIILRTCVDVVGDCTCTSHVSEETKRKRRALAGEL